MSVGEGVFYRVSDREKRHKANGKWTVSQVIHDLDKRCSLQVPMFLFGFSTLGRGVSTRSSERVVTHLLVGLGPGFPLDSVIQAMGRATGNIKSVLERNFGKDVMPKVLVNEKDWSDSQEYVKCCAAQVNGTDPSQKLPKRLAEQTQRRVGQRRSGKQCPGTSFTNDYPSDEDKTEGNEEEEIPLQSGAILGTRGMPKREKPCRQVTDDSHAKRQRLEE